MHSITRGLIFLSTLLILASVAYAGPTINSADLVVVGYNSDNNDDIALLALADIPGNSVIFITDEGWTNGFSFSSTEEAYKWVVPAGGISSGTIIRFASPGDLLVFSGTSYGTLTRVYGTSKISLAAGDQIFLYQTDNDSYTGTIQRKNGFGGTEAGLIYGFNGDNCSYVDHSDTLGWYASGVRFEVSVSALPTNMTALDSSNGYSNASSANANGMLTQVGLKNNIAAKEWDNYKYEGDVSPATKNEWLVRIHTPTNWVANDTSGYDMTTDSLASNVTVNSPNAAPTISTNNGLKLNEGATVTIPIDSLEADDVDSENSTLSFIITTNSSNGTLKKSGVTLNTGDTLTQANLTSGIITYVHDGSNTTSDSFVFKVVDEDGGELTGQTFAITVVAVDDDTPSISINNAVSVYTGKSKIIDSTNILATDTDSRDSSLIYSISTLPKHGVLKLSGSILQNGDSFSKMDLLDKNLIFEHNGDKELKDTLVFSVADIAGNTLVDQSLSFNIIPFESGNGSQNDPFVITNVTQLQAMQNFPSGSYFVLGNDIDASDSKNWDNGAGFMPVGYNTNNRFKSVFNGRNYSINNLYINRPEMGNVGLFGYTRETRVDSVKLVNVDITGQDNVGALIGYANSTNIAGVEVSGKVSGGNAVGGVLGYIYYGATLRNADAKVKVKGNTKVGGVAGRVYRANIYNSSFSDTVIGSDIVGGITGEIGYANIDDCWTSGYVTGNDRIGGIVGSISAYSSGNRTSYVYSAAKVFGKTNVGGIAGELVGELQESFYTGDVEGEQFVGGVVGFSRQGAKLRDSYASGTVKGDSAVGGVIGFNRDGSQSTLLNLYSTAKVFGEKSTGALIGIDTLGGNLSSVYDTTAVGFNQSSAGLPQSSTEMLNKQNYENLGWDFATTWEINDNVSYPVLSGYDSNFVVEYSSTANGSISGTSSQAIARGYNSTAVTAVPASGYSFIQWSDGDTSATRVDYNVNRDIQVSAEFADNVAPILDVKTSLSLDEGATALVNNSTLSASDGAATSSQIHFTIQTSSLNGSLQHLDSLDKALQSFTQSDIENNKVQYVHAGGENIADSVVFTLSDGVNISDTFKLIIQINPVNDAPILVQSILDTTLAEDFASFSYIDLKTVFSDAEKGSDLEYTVHSLKGIVDATLSASDSSLVFSSKENVVGEDTIVLQASDGSLSVSDTLTIIVTAENDAPVWDELTISEIKTETDVAKFFVELKASDVDSENLEFILGGEDAKYFEIRNDSLFLSADVELIASEQSLAVSLIVSDGKLKATKDINVQLPKKTSLIKNVAIASNNLQWSIEAYQLLVDVKGSWKLDVLNASGKRIFNQLGNGKTTISLSNLNSGQYFLVLRNFNSQMQTLPIRVRP